MSKEEMSDEDPHEIVDVPLQPIPEALAGWNENELFATKPFPEEYLVGIPEQTDPIEANSANYTRLLAAMRDLGTPDHYLPIPSCSFEQEKEFLQFPEEDTLSIPEQTDPIEAGSADYTRLHAAMRDLGTPDQYSPILSCTFDQEEDQNQEAVSSDNGTDESPDEDMGDESDNELFAMKQFPEEYVVGIPEQTDPIEAGSADYAHPYAAMRDLGSPIPSCSFDQEEDQNQEAILSDSGTDENPDEDMDHSDDECEAKNVPEGKEVEPEYTEDQETDRESDEEQETDPEGIDEQETVSPVTPGMYKKADVLMGRGGRTNKHSGNKLYLADKEELRKRYMTATKREKTLLSKELVHRVHARGGRFVKKIKKTKKWEEVDFRVARKKAGQALREESSAESRLQKRLRYG